MNAPTVTKSGDRLAAALNNPTTELQRYIVPRLKALHMTKAMAERQVAEVRAGLAKAEEGLHRLSGGIDALQGLLTDELDQLTPIKTPPPPSETASAPLNGAETRLSR